jgi:hypothetical protein
MRPLYVFSTTIGLACFRMRPHVSPVLEGGPG